jgi:hypothetical protein
LIILAHDAIHVNVPHLPAGQAAGYTTGTPDIRWTAQDWAAHHGAVRICQDSGASDTTADVLDVERGAAANGECGHWYKTAIVAFSGGTRPGQRHPAIYTSASNVTPVVNALKAAGVSSGPALWIANWNLSDAQASADVLAASGPYPVIGIQFSSGQFYDTDVFSSAWLNHTSTAPSTAGPHRHTADGRHSFDTYAAARHTTGQHLWDETFKAYTPADRTAAQALMLPFGWPYYTTNA